MSPSLKHLVVCISGSTCTGKTSLVRLFESVFPDSTVFNQDKYYFPDEDPRHTWCSTLKHINWELVSAFDNLKLASDIEQESKSNFETKSSFVDFQQVLNKVNKFEDSGASLFHSREELSELGLNLLKDLKNVPLIFVEGITILNHPLTSSVCDLKFFLTLDHATCLQRRLLRSYDPPDVPGYFEQVVWPEYLHLWEDVQVKHKKEFIELDGRETIEENFIKILKTILHHLANRA